MVFFRRVLENPLAIVVALTVLPGLYAFSQASAGRRPALMASASSSLENSRRVLVTGAGGRTGKLVFEKLQAKPGFQPIGLVRSQKSAKPLRQAGATDEQIAIGDVMDPASLRAAMQNVDSVVLCTSATPKIVYTSLVKMMVKKLFRQEPGRPKFTFPLDPEQVDYTGAMNQIDAAISAGVKHFVVVGSMGGTQPENFLNTIGKKEDGTGGDILLWKRKAEMYLIEKAKANPSLSWTIIHPGGLLDKPGGVRELVLDVDDKLLSRTTRSIPRADVAEICVQALLHDDAKNRAFDCVSEAEGEGTVTTDFKALFATLKTKPTYQY